MSKRLTPSALATIWANHPDVQNHFAGSFDALSAFATSAHELHARFELLLAAQTKLSGPSPIGRDEGVAIWLCSPEVRAVVPSLVGALAIFEREGTEGLRGILDEAKNRAAA